MAASATALRIQGTLALQLNLGRGALEVAERPRVVARAYWPLLELLDACPWLRTSLEIDGHTLQRLARLDPDWLGALRTHVEAGRVELLGVGEAPLVAPLVPLVVNRWNQLLGRAAVAEHTGLAPRIARAGEPAWSQGLVDAYLDAGYEALVLDSRRSGTGKRPPQGRRRGLAAWTASPAGRRIRVLWRERALDETLARTLRGEEDGIEADLRALEGARTTHAFLHAGALEDLAPDGLARLTALVEHLHAEGLAFVPPSALLRPDEPAPPKALVLTPSAEPIRLAAGQRLARWALSGRDNLGLNARCFRRAHALEARGGTPEDWRLLCRAWSAELRTDLTEARWRSVAAALPAERALPGRRALLDEAPIRRRLVERAGRRLAVGTDGVRVVLHTGRGLALESLVLRPSGTEPLAGAHPASAPGDLEAFGALSGHVRFEGAGLAPVSDLVPVRPLLEDPPGAVHVRARVATELGTLAKEVRVHAHRLELAYGFGELGPVPHPRVRVGFLTLLEDAFRAPLWVSCANGGARERWALPADPGAPLELVLGATEGWLAVDDGRVGLDLSWTLADAPALPVIECRSVAGRGRVRLSFLLRDDPEPRARPAPLRDFRLSVRPWRRRG